MRLSQPVDGHPDRTDPRGFSHCNVSSTAVANIRGTDASAYAGITCSGDERP
jgi:hypothetical protein